jgi:hypothetical protein
VYTIRDIPPAAAAAAKEAAAEGVVAGGGSKGGGGEGEVRGMGEKVHARPIAQKKVARAAAINPPETHRKNAEVKDENPA